MNREFTLTAVATLAMGLSALPALAEDFPRQSLMPELDGKASSFVGNWQMAFPESDPYFKGRVIYGCEDPMTITTDGDLVVHGFPDGPDAIFAVSVRDGHTILDLATEKVPPWEIVWVDENTANFHTVGVDGTTDWKVPFVYSRCD
ncbi:hypothetical protein [Cucumibacter marinus]|uniref:hypothetical protein n=1 Tax=Cucumibacter marinus TaxID=1121252 RepID=UPI0003FF2E38|nr:hypothetical protein [Cucumibacter marinus]